MNSSTLNLQLFVVKSHHKSRHREPQYGFSKADDICNTSPSFNVASEHHVSVEFSLALLAEARSGSLSLSMEYHVSVGSCFRLPSLFIAFRVTTLELWLFCLVPSDRVSVGLGSSAGSGFEMFTWLVVPRHCHISKPSRLSSIVGLDQVILHVRRSGRGAASSAKQNPG